MKNLLDSFRMPLCAVVAGLAFALVSEPSASAKPPVPITGTVDIKTGLTSVIFTDAFATALTDASLEARKIIPGQFVKGHNTYRFPIRSGALDLTTLQAEIIHSGGVKFQSESVSLSLTDFIVTLPAVEEPVEPAEEVLPVEPAPQPTLSALVVVNGKLLGRIDLFVLEIESAGLAKPHTLPKNKKLSLTKVPFTLTAEGAEVLNSGLEVTTFVEGAAAGEVSVLAITTKQPL